jgi:hypothetical protein
MTEKEALKLALEALEYLEEHLPFDWAFDELQSLAGKDDYRQSVKEARDLIPKIKEALAQPEYQSTADKSQLEKIPAKGTLLAQPEHEWLRGECVKCGQSIERQEPVAWVSEIAEEAELMLEKPRFQAVPLYTTPPPVAEPHKRPSRSDIKPLTDEEIEALLDKVIANKKSRNQMGDFARAIEAAHGIKGEA